VPRFGAVRRGELPEPGCSPIGVLDAGGLCRPTGQAAAEPWLSWNTLSAPAVGLACGSPGAGGPVAGACGQLRSCLGRLVGGGDAAGTAGCAGPQLDGSRTATGAGSAGFVRPTGGRRNRRITAMRMRAKLTIGAVAAGLALTACGSAGGPASGAHRDHAGATSPQHVQQAGVSDAKAVVTAKRDHWAAVLGSGDRAQRG